MIILSDSLLKRRSHYSR